jgi:uncharacterized protein (DUF1330 family)
VLKTHHPNKDMSMPAYVIGHITVKDDDKWAEYRHQVPATLAPWGADLMFRGKTKTVLSGSHVHTDVVVIRFPDTQAVDGWYSSDAYQALIPLRTEAADVDLIHYEAAL